MISITGNPTIDVILLCAVAAVLLYLGYRLGRFLGEMAAARTIAGKEQELFTAQKGFRTLYEQEIATLKAENEQLKAKVAAMETRVEEALYAQNEKLRQERTDALKEQLRSAGYRRVLMSQLLSDERIKSYVAEILADEKRLPPPEQTTAPAPALPEEAKE
jgi:FtsZ-binding cell division protein ZapB